MFVDLTTDHYLYPHTHEIDECLLTNVIIVQDRTAFKRPRLDSTEVSPSSSFPALSSQVTTSNPTDQSTFPPMKRRCYRLVMTGFPNCDDDPSLQFISAPNEQIAVSEAQTS